MLIGIHICYTVRFTYIKVRPELFSQWVSPYSIRMDTPFEAVMASLFPPSPHTYQKHLNNKYPGNCHIRNPVEPQ